MVLARTEAGVGRYRPGRNKASTIRLAQFFVQHQFP